MQVACARTSSFSPFILLEFMNSYFDMSHDLIISLCYNLVVADLLTGVLPFYVYLFLFVNL